MHRIIKKKDIKRLVAEGQEKDYAADTSATNATPQEIVNKTRQEHSDADSVTIPSKEMDGNSSTQVNTVEVNDDPASLNNARRMASTFQSQGQDVNFKVKLNSGLERNGELMEGVTFSKAELREFLLSC